MNIYWYAPFENADELDIARHIPGDGDTLTVQALSSRFGEPLPADETAPFTLIRDLPEPAGEDGRSPTRLRRLTVAVSRAKRRDRLVRSRRFDLLHIHTFNMFTDWLALPVLRRTASSMVGTVHNVLPHDRRGPAAAERWLHRTGYRTFDHIFVAHEHLREMLVSQFEVPAEQVSVVPLPVLHRPDHNDAAGRDCREFLFFGTLRHNKGVPVLLEAISLVQDEHVRFRFAGRGPDDLEDLVRTAAAGDNRITAELGFVTDERRTELMKRAWAIVLPYTEFDAQSGVLQDAYSFRVPVIATTVGALGAAVSAEETGWTVEPGDPEALAECIATAASSTTPREEMVGRIDAIAHGRSPERIAAALRAQYRLLA